MCYRCFCSHIHERERLDLTFRKEPCLLSHTIMPGACEIAVLQLNTFLELDIKLNCHAYLQNKIRFFALKFHGPLRLGSVNEQSANFPKFHELVYERSGHMDRRPCHHNAPLETDRVCLTLRTDPVSPFAPFYWTIQSLAG